MSNVSDKPRTTPVFVQTPMHRYLTAGLGLLLSLGGVFAVYGLIEWGPHAFFPGFALAAAAGVLLIVFLSQRPRRLEVTLTGFVITQRGRREVYSDEAVSGVSIGQEMESEFDRLIRRRFVLEVGGEEDADPISCSYEFPRGASDPLAPFLDRIVRRLAERLNEGPPFGGTLTGEGWRLDPDGLHCRDEVLPLDRIARAGLFLDRLCVWKDDDEWQFFTTPAASRNAHVLALLLRGAVMGRLDRSPPPSGDYLGRALLEHRPVEFRLGLTVLGCGPLVSLAPFACLLASQVPELAAIVLAVVYAPCAVVGIALLWSAERGRLMFHEYGVRQQGRKELLYREIGTMIWWRAGLLRFEPLPGLDRPTIYSRTPLGWLAVELDVMRDLMARIIARRWLVELERGAVPWTRRLRFLPEGLEFTPADSLGGEAFTVPYHRLRWRVECGHVLLFVHGPYRAPVREPLFASNVFPAIALLELICQGTYGLDAPAPPRPPDERFTDYRPSP